VSAPVRRGGRLVDDAGRSTTWSMAEGSRGRRWRWTVVDRRGNLLASHTLELDPEGRFSHLESAIGAGLLSLHREADGSLHGNRLSERGVDHLQVPAPAPRLVLVGSGPIGLVAMAAGLADGAAEREAGRDSGQESGEALELDVVEVADDLGVRLAEARIHRGEGGRVEVRMDRGTRRVTVDASGLPPDDGSSTTSWPLERD
jgi:hypothetical protein